MSISALAQLLNEDDRDRQIRSELDWVRAVRSGLPVSSVTTAVDELEFTPDEIDRFVISRRLLTQRRAKGQPLTRDESIRLARIARVALNARETFGDPEKARRWLRRPNRALGEQTPISLLDTDDGARLVETVLGRLAYGVFS
jgi:putative toxin-antitoxin system antitoxin component (TIGR02293 family)